MREVTVRFTDPDTKNRYFRKLQQTNTVDSAIQSFITSQIPMELRLSLLGAHLFAEDEQDEQRQERCQVGAREDREGDTKACLVREW